MKMKAAMFGVVALVICQTANGSDLFNANERSLFFFGGYVDKHDSEIAPGAGLSYFLTRHIGVSAFTHWENTSGSFIDNVTGELQLRLPLRELPLAPYGLLGLGYSFETEETFEHFGAGAEWRFSERWGVFGDCRWQINQDTSDGVGLRLGLRMAF